MSEAKGISLVIATALVSSVSIFLNKFAVSGFNPFVFTTLKNVLVAVFLFCIIFLFREIKNLKLLSKAQWAKLVLIGLVGGSIPFLIYFYALKLTSAVNAGFLHKTLFLWAFLMAAVFLKEKLSRKFLLGAIAILAGNFFLFSKFSGFGFADALILIAAIMWAGESVLAKHALRELDGKIVGFGRMFFGSVFMLVFLGATNQLGGIALLNFDQWLWVLVTGAFLFLYVLFYYSGLKFVRVSVATAVLALAQPITAVLSFAFDGKIVGYTEAIGFLLLVIGSALIVGSGYFLLVASKLKSVVLGKA